MALGCLSSPGIAVDSKPIDAELVSANTEFGFNLFAKLAGGNREENIFISPTSIAIALEMTYNGAREETQKAMAEALSLQGMSLQEMNQANADLMSSLEDLDDVQLGIANSLWARKGDKFKPDFMKRNQEFYRAYIETLDFAAPDALSTINDWVKKETGGKIEEMVDEIDAGIILLLINAVYFRGTWMVEFNKEATKEGEFTLLDGSKKMVPMMIARSDHYRSCWGENFRAIALPYGNEKVSMYIFLPGENSNLVEFCRELSAGSWEGWMSKFKKYGEATVSLPRFNMEYEIVLNKALGQLGMGVAFDPDKANFGGMCEGNCWIDEVKHKTSVEVKEEGTEASAATTVKMKRGAPPLVINRPFFCAIRDDTTGAILFMGCIVEP
jgi:serpin B